MESRSPYISVVVTSRNDDHGGTLLRRMQTFVGAFIAQCQRHDLAVELIIVEWNPPADRPRLAHALRWPDQISPCRVRIIEVPAEIHQQFLHAESLPLFQMIAKNVGIRRAAGRFVLCTNIDVLFNDRLMLFLAAEKLRSDRMYRIDRHDVDTNVPVHAELSEQLDYCESHMLRVNARDGIYRLAPTGERIPEAPDLVSQGDGIVLGDGWRLPEKVNGTLYRWMANQGEIQFHLQEGGTRYLRFQLEPGPGVNYGGMDLSLLDDSGDEVFSQWFPEGVVFLVRLKLPPGKRVVYRLLCRNGGRPCANDPHILNFRLLELSWSDAATFARLRPGGASASPVRIESLHTLSQNDVVAGDVGILFGDGWSGLEVHRGENYRRAGEGAVLWVDPPRESEASRLRILLERSDALCNAPATLQIAHEDGAIAWQGPVRCRSWIELDLPAISTRRGLVFSVQGLDATATDLVRHDHHRVLRLERTTYSSSMLGLTEIGSVMGADLVSPEQGIRFGAGWFPVEEADGQRYRWAGPESELLLDEAPEDRPCLVLEIEPARGDQRRTIPLTFFVQGEPTVHVAGVSRNQQLLLRLPEASQGTRKLTLRVEEPPIADNSDPRSLSLRLLRIGWMAMHASLPDSNSDASSTIWDVQPNGWHAGRDVAEVDSGLRFGAGWRDPESYNEDHYRWAETHSTIHVPTELIAEGALVCDVEPGPGARYGAFDLELLDGKDGILARARVDSRQRVEFTWNRVNPPAGPFHFRAARKKGTEGPCFRLFRLCRTRGDGEATPLWQPNSSFAAKVWHLGDVKSLDVVDARAGIRFGRSWHPPQSEEGLPSRWAGYGAILLVRDHPGSGRRLILDIEPGPRLGNAPFWLEVRDANWQSVDRFRIEGRQSIVLSLPPTGKSSVYYELIPLENGAPACDLDSVQWFRLWRCRWDHAPLDVRVLSPKTRADEPPRAQYKKVPMTAAGLSAVASSLVSPRVPRRAQAAAADAERIISPVHLHINACGDFTLLAKEKWHELRGNPELQMYSLHLDTLLCYTAHHGGCSEEMLPEDCRLYHIEHGAGSGWTPEGAQLLLERMEAKGIPVLPYERVMNWATEMRREGRPIVWNEEEWGLRDLALPEIVIADVDADWQAGPRDEAA